MIPAAVVVDTNVVVAGLLSASDASPVARILDGMLTAAFPFALSEALLSEYRVVLLRARIRARHGLNVDEVETLLVELAQHAIVVTPVATFPAPDPGDQFLWELLAARADLSLVTGDRRLLHDPDMRARVLSPETFAKRMWAS